MRQYLLLGILLFFNTTFASPMSTGLSGSRYSIEKYGNNYATVRRKGRTSKPKEDPKPKGNTEPKKETEIGPWDIRRDPAVSMAYWEMLNGRRPRDPYED